MKQPRPLVLTGGKLVTPDGVHPGAVRCVDGRIDAVGAVAAQDGDEVVEARTLLQSAPSGSILFRAETARLIGTCVN